MRENSKRTYWNNREEKLEYAKQYRQKNKDEINKKQREKRLLKKLEQSL